MKRNFGGSTMSAAQRISWPTLGFQAQATAQRGQPGRLWKAFWKQRSTETRNKEHFVEATCSNLERYLRAVLGLHAVAGELA
jgi:hypothetical protein